MVWPFKRKRIIVQPSGKFPIPPIDIEWSERDVAFMSQVIRVHGQPDNEGWRRQARIALHFLQTPRFIESIARHIEIVLNGEWRQDAPITSGHYMMGEPNWMSWVEYALPVAMTVCQAIKQKSSSLT
jgi:hypothetical protein